MHPEQVELTLGIPD